MGLFGFFISTFHTHFTNTILLTENLKNVTVQGEVDLLKNRITSAEIILKNPVIQGVSSEKMPEKIKIRRIYER